MLTSYELVLGRHELMMRFCVYLAVLTRPSKESIRDANPPKDVSSTHQRRHIVMNFKVIDLL